MPKSPLRYPGGKQRAIAQIAQHLPQQFSEYREPFVGGGSVLFFVLEHYPETNCWINDLNPELYCFWTQVRDGLLDLVDRIWWMRGSYSDGRELFNLLSKADPASMTQLDRAARFFVLNRITFSGTIESGGYSQSAFQDRFTPSSIERLVALEGCLDRVKITNLDYSELLEAPGDDVFIFLDPPYLSRAKSKLYGRKGDLHIQFDHSRFAELMSNCSHRWLITYDDCPEVRSNFGFAQMHEWSLQYGMNNYRQGRAERGNELFIASLLVTTYA